MKLYLSSQHLGNEPEKLIELVGDNKKVAVVANAIDDKPSSFRKIRVDREINMLETIGLQPDELDLRNYFNDSSELSEYLSTKSLVWVRGGNSFILRRAMIESGFDDFAIPLINENKLVYGGYSAALIAASKDLFGVEIVDNPHIIPEGYTSTTKILSGLGLIDFYLIPHEDADEPWANSIAEHLNHLRQNDKTVKTLRDGEVLIINNVTREVTV